jgi:nucleotide-binding universal stress UspA family protein
MNTSANPTTPAVPVAPDVDVPAIPTIERVLVPIDFSETAAGAARYADALAQRVGAKVTLLHVVPPLSFDYAMAEPTESRAQELRQQRLGAAEQALGAFPSFAGTPGPGRSALTHEPTRAVAEGDAAEQILAYLSSTGQPSGLAAPTIAGASESLAHAKDTDLIVMPTRGRSALQRWLTIGSVTQRILHDADCPVLAGVDFSHAGVPLRLDHILCAVDLGEKTHPVLAWGAGLSRVLGARLSIVHAMAHFDEAAGDAIEPGWRGTLESRLRDRVATAAAAAGADGEVIVEPGEPHTVVSATASRLGARLVIIGRGVSHDLIGRLRAHAFEIIRQSPCPVVSL